MYTFQWTAESSFHETLEDPRLPQSPEYPFRSCRWSPITKASVRSGVLKPFNVMLWRKHTDTHTHTHTHRHTQIHADTQTHIQTPQYPNQRFSRSSFSENFAYPSTTTPPHTHPPHPSRSEIKENRLRIWPFQPETIPAKKIKKNHRLRF